MLKDLRYFVPLALSTLFWRYSLFACFPNLNNALDRFFGTIFERNENLLYFAIAAFSLVLAAVVHFTFIEEREPKSKFYSICVSAMQSWNYLAAGFFLAALILPFPDGFPLAAGFPDPSHDSLGTGMAGFVIAIGFYLVILAVLWIAKLIAGAIANWN